jgi:hypothetical protein
LAVGGRQIWATNLNEQMNKNKFNKKFVEKNVAEFES